jgi:hypothetical protein
MFCMDEVVDYTANAVSALDSLDIMGDAPVVEAAPEVAVEPSVEEPVEGEEAIEGEEVVEEATPEAVAAPEVVELQASVEKTQRQVKHLQKRLKSEGDRAKTAEEQLKALTDRGIDKAQALAAVAFGPNRDFGKVYELLGLDPMDVVEYYKEFIPNADKVKEKIVKDREEASAKSIAAERAELTKKSLSLQATGVLNKYAQNLPVLAAMGDKAVDQVVEKIRELYTANDPVLKGISSFDEAVKKVLPIVEKERRRELRPLIEAFSKIEAAKAAKEKPAEVAKKEEKPSSKAPVAKAKVEPKAKATLKGSPGSPSTKVSRPVSEEERLNQAVDVFLQNL